MSPLELCPKYLFWNVIMLLLRKNNKYICKRGWLIVD